MCTIDGRQVIVDWAFPFPGTKSSSRHVCTWYPCQYHICTYIQGVHQLVWLFQISYEKSHAGIRSSIDDRDEKKLIAPLWPLREILHYTYLSYAYSHHCLVMLYCLSHSRVTYMYRYFVSGILYGIFFRLPIRHAVILQYICSAFFPLIL